jgi:hypothetical protein
MKAFVSTLAMAILLTFTGPAVAEDLTKATTEADCEKAGGVWQARSNECAEESAKMGKEEGTHEGAQLGDTHEEDTKKVDQPERADPGTGN